MELWWYWRCLMTINQYDVLLVDDDQDVLDSYAHLMSISGLTAKLVNDPTQACQYLSEDWSGVVLLDMYMPQMHGMELLALIKEIDEHIPVLVITGHGDIPMAVDALKKGACEFFEKPISPPELLTKVKSYLKERQAYTAQKSNVSQSVGKALVGKSAQIEQIRQHVARFALINTNVVICGESGSGRHSIAHLLHDMSQPRKDQTLEELYLTADHDKEAIARYFNGGSVATLVIENVQSMNEKTQREFVQLLLSQERGSTSKTRVITLFDASPEQLMSENRLLPELYYLLNQGAIQVPSLRHRPDDIAAIFHHFLKHSCQKLGKPMPAVDSSYLSLLRNHQWPGNVRELRNVAELYAIGIVKLTGKERLVNQNELQSPLDTLVDDFEKQIIEDALFLHSGKVTEAAVYLQIPRKKLYLRMKKHDIDKDNYKSR
ncbi:sigma-54-dependent Fis family transcriptional regulator [Vibrio vulnificus]|nr:sigma-54-dependent Fis family transcriptional regulator [Vibrio vulnificus]